MAIQTMLLDPNAQAYTGDEMITEINGGAASFTREDLLDQDLLRIIKTSPASGKFNVKNIQRDSTGKLEVDYDDVPAA
jgi:hypothetical protein